MKLKLFIIGVVVLLLALGGYFVINTGVLSVYTVVPEVNEPNARRESIKQAKFENPNQSVKPPVFRTILEQDNILFIRGTSAANSVVSILGNGVRRRQIRANEDGIWEAEIDVTADNILGLSLISFLTEDISINGDELLIRAVLSRPELPIDGNIVSEIDGDIVIGARPPALILLTAPGGPSRVIQSPFGSLPNREALTLGAIEYDDLGGVIFSGFASRAGRVRIFGDDILIGESRVSNDGRWFLIAADTLPLKDYNLRVQLQDANGTDTNLVVNIRRLQPGQNAEQTPYIVFNENVWHVRRNLTGGGVQYTAILSSDSLLPLDEVFDTPP